MPFASTVPQKLFRNPRRNKTRMQGDDSRINMKEVDTENEKWPASGESVPLSFSVTNSPGQTGTGGFPGMCIVQFYNCDSPGHT